VVSDWGAVSDRVAALHAGLDLEMPGSSGYSDAQLIRAVQAGTLPPDLVLASARRVLALAARVPARDAPNNEAPFNEQAHHDLARDLATQCAVLLKNDDDALPLGRGSSIAVVGEFARTPRFQGGGSSHVTPTRIDAALPALESLAARHDCTVRFAEGFRITGMASGSAERAEAAALRNAAAALAAGADTCVVFAGLPDAHESEGTDRSSLALPHEQVDVIRAVAAAAPRTVVVLSHGGVLTCEEWHDDVDAILDGYLLGQAGGSALADLLFGEVNPSGRLAETAPVRLADHPAYLNFPGEQGHVRYGEGVMVGYRYYASADVGVRYPFGYGLSYSTFRTSDLTVDVTGDATVDVSVQVTNTGSREGRHVVQVYVATEAGPVRRPVRELRAFDKVLLAPGQSRVVRFELDRRAFAYYDIEHADWVVARGEYRIQIGDNARDILLDRPVTLAGEPQPVRLTLESTVQAWLSDPAVGPVVMKRLMDRLEEVPPSEQDGAGGDMANAFAMIASMPMRAFATFPGVGLGVDVLERLLAERESGAK
jgi:beta-glucosidase